MSFERARAIADAVLYEGYVLYPYRASSTKNQWRWQFGVLAPRAWSEAGGCEPWAMQTECLVEPSAGDGGSVIELEGCVRALRLCRRSIERLVSREPERFEPVATLDVGDERLTSWDEGLEVELPFTHSIERWVAGAPRTPRTPRILERVLSGARAVEPIRTPDGTVVGRCVRETLPLVLQIEVRDEIAMAMPDVVRLRVRVENHTDAAELAAPREVALRGALAGVHTLLAVRGGAFLSIVDGPAWAADVARACQNVGTWPILAGEPGKRDVLLSSPIILADHPGIAPESPGDMCDATEIDEILTLRTLTLTEEEKRDSRGTDARSRAIVDRVETMPPETLAALHGARRDPVIARGARVRLRPGARRADAQDMFFEGRIGTVEDVLVDFEGNDYVAVTLEDDPATEMHRWYGRFLYFTRDEIELLGVAEVAS